MGKMSQSKFTVIELEKHKLKVARQAREIEQLRNRIEGQQAQIKASTLFIAVMAAQLTGGTVPSEGEIVINKDDLSAALGKQKVDWYEDKENNQIVIRLGIVQPEENGEGGQGNDLQPDNQGETSAEGNNDSNVSEEGQEQQLCSKESDRSQEAPED